MPVKVAKGVLGVFLSASLKNPGFRGGLHLEEPYTPIPDPVGTASEHETLGGWVVGDMRSIVGR